MGTVFVRRGVLFIGYLDPSRPAGHQRVYKNTGLKPTEKRAALRLLAEVEAELAGVQRTQDAALETVSGFFEKWKRERIAAGNRNAKADEKRFASYVLPSLGQLALGDVRPRHIRQLVAKLRADDRAPRTVINTYGLVRRFFLDAIAEELITASPCALKRGDLPKKADKNPRWRETAVFTREERDQMLADPRIPLDRRVTYALGFCAALREGEIAALRWSAVDLERGPLGSIEVAVSYSRKNGVETTTKTGKPRMVPVHAALAAMLRQWRASGFAHYFGKEPEPGDLFVPSRHGSYRTDHAFLKGLKRDLKALGFRHRRFHDTRRTFITLSRTDGAPDNVMRTITHDQQGDIVDQYTSFAWPTLCAAMAMSRIEPAVPREVLRMAVGSSEFTSTNTSKGEDTMPTTENKSASTSGREGTRNPPATHGLSVFRGSGGSRKAHGGSAEGPKTPNGRKFTSTNIAEDLAAALASFERNDDRKALATRLRVVLARLRGGK